MLLLYQRDSLFSIGNRRFGHANIFLQDAHQQRGINRLFDRVVHTRFHLGKIRNVQADKHRARRHHIHLHHVFGQTADERLRRHADKQPDNQDDERICRAELNAQNLFFSFIVNQKNSLRRGSQLVDINKLGLNRKIKKFSYSFICGKGYSPPFGGRIAFCLQAEQNAKHSTIETALSPKSIF